VPNDLPATLGPVVCDWIETYLVHGPGDIAGDPIHIDAEFRAFIYRAYELTTEGRRIFRRAVLSRPKGRAKSELAAMIACAEALGPVRFDGNDANGDPVGIPVSSPLIKCYATEEGQAGNTYDAVQYMLANGSVFDEYAIDVGLTRTFLLDVAGEIVAQTSAAKSKDGGKETFAVFDESHLWILPQLKALHETVTFNLMKRKMAEPWSLETTTMYVPGEGSVAEETAKAFKSGDVESLLYDHKGASLDVDITNDEALRDALCYVYGPASEWMDIDGMVTEFRNPQNRESELRRKLLNQPVSTEEMFTNGPAWDALADPSRNPADGARIVLSFDGSLNNDATALIGVTLEEKPHVFVAGVWEKTLDDLPDWTVDFEEVENRIREIRKQYDVVEFAADDRHWKRTLEMMFSEGMNAVVFPQSAARMTPATNRFGQLIAMGGMTHDGNLRLREHVLNAVLVEDSRGVRLYKAHKKSARKIDLAVATCMGLDRAGVLVNVEPTEYAHVYVYNPEPKDDDETPAFVPTPGVEYARVY